MSDAIEAARLKRIRSHIGQSRVREIETVTLSTDDALFLHSAALTAYEAAKGGGVDASFPTALSDSEVRIWINACNHEPARQALRQLLAYRVRGVSSALTSPASGSVQPRSFWMHYDHQSGSWIVDDRPPNVVRTGSEVIHVLEVLPTSPASGERDAVIEVTDAMVEDGAVAIDALWSEGQDRGPAFAETEREYQAHCRSTARAAIVAALRMEGK